MHGVSRISSSPAIRTLDFLSDATAITRLTSRGIPMRTNRFFTNRNSSCGVDPVYLDKELTGLSTEGRTSLTFGNECFMLFPELGERMLRL
jgi:hypothetical protein